MKKYILVTAGFIIVGGFIGCLIGLTSGPSAASTGTGYGCLVGGILAAGYYLATQDTPAA